MLVGVTVATPITATSGDNTNYVLKDGAFHPTSGGNIKANRAYLQIPSSISSSALHIDFGEEEEEGGEVNGVIEVNEGKEVSEVSDNSWYTINGLKLDTKPATKGLYIHNGKKYVIR